MTNSSTNNLDIIETKSDRVKNLLNFLGLDKYSKPVITILNLHGIIGKTAMKSGLTFDAMNDQIEDAFSPKKLTAVLLNINSPGGSPVQAELIARRIMQLSKEKNVPVYAFVQDMAASGGYWLACAADEIYASASSIIGSIGVISAGFGFVEAIKKLGVERRVYFQGNNKSILDPFKTEKPEDIELLSKLQQEVHESFKDYVKSRRKGRLTQSEDILFTGQFWCGQTAKDFGLIDGIENLYDFIEKNYGTKVEIKYIKTKESWIKRKFGISINLNSKDLVDAASDKIDENLVNNIKLF
jgi:signal peptide peptidase SppA